MNALILLTALRRSLGAYRVDDRCPEFPAEPLLTGARRGIS